MTSVTRPFQSYYNPVHLKVILQCLQISFRGEEILFPFGNIHRVSLKK